jgi:Mce-associated membrane protein
MSDDIPMAPSRRGARLLAALAALLLLLALSLGYVVKGQRDDRARLTDARNDALTAGRQLIVNLDSISAATIDRDLTRVLDGSTGKFKEQFERAKDQLKALVVQRKTVSSGRVLSAGVVRADAESATLLVAADRTVTDTTSPQGQVGHDRWKVEMEKRGGKWLVAELEPVA